MAIPSRHCELDLSRLPSPLAADNPFADSARRISLGTSLVVWLLTLLLLGSNSVEAATRTQFSSRYSGATIFRDANRNGSMDAREMRLSTRSDAAGSFFLPRGSGRLFLQGGVDLDTGQPNDLLLTTPSGTRGIGVLTSLFQALSERKPRRPATPRSLLGLGPRVALRSITFAPVQANADTATVLRRDAQQSVLARLFKGLSLGAGGPSAGGRLVARATLTAQPRPRFRGDAAIGALAEALLSNGNGSRTLVDLSDSDTIREVINDGLATLQIPPPAQVETIVQAVTGINTAFDDPNTAPNSAEFGKLQQIADNALAVIATSVATNDFDTLSTQFTGDGLQQQIDGTVFTPPRPANPTELASIGADGAPANATSQGVAISADGRYVAFASSASNLTAEPGSELDIFLRDTIERTTTRVTVAAGNLDDPANSISNAPALSGDGRFVAFESFATNLTRPPVTPAEPDLPAVYLRDTQRGVTTLVTPNRSGQAGSGFTPSVSGDGTRIVFSSADTNLVASDGNGLADIFLRDTARRTTTRISLSATGGDADGLSREPSISFDGGFVSFTSEATNLVAGLTDSNAQSDVFLRDIGSRTPINRLVSRTPGGVPGDGLSGQSSVSANGRFVAFVSDADNLVAAFDGSAFPQVWRFDRDATDPNVAMQLVSQTPTGSPGNGPSAKPTISDDGRFVAFTSEATDLAATPSGSSPSGSNIYVRDMEASSPVLASTGLGGSFGELANGISFAPSLSKDGRRVAFLSQANNIVAGDINASTVADVFAVTLFGDLADDPTTLGRIALGATVTGTVDTPGDRDWFAVTLTAGTSYQVDLEGAGTGQGTLTDPIVLGIFDSQGIAVENTGNDNGGINQNARQIFTPAATGTYYISAGGTGDLTGTFRLSLIDAPGQTITFETLPNRTLGEAPFTVSATADSGLPVTFSALTTGICTVEGNTVTLVATGTCSIAADQAGSATVPPASRVTRSFTVLSSQTITFPSLNNRVLGSGVFTVSATASSGLAVTFSSLTPSTCSVTGTSVTPIAVGTCTLAADQAGNAQFAPAPQVSQSFSIVTGGDVAPQTITFDALQDRALSASPFSVAATASSGLSVTFSSTTPSVCSVSGNSVALLTTGTCSIAADQAGNAQFAPAPQVVRSFVVLQTQTIDFPALGNQTLGNAPFVVSATASSGLAVTLSSLTTSVCTIAGNTVELLAEGTCTIAADQAGNTQFGPAPRVTRSFTIAAPVNRQPQTIAFNALPDVSLNASPLTLSATATSGLTVTFTSSTAAVCRVNGTSLTLIDTGTCTIAANQIGDASFLPAPQVARSFAVTPQPLTAIPVPLAVPADNLDHPFTVSLLNAEPNPRTVNLAIAATGIATVSPASVTIPANQTTATANIKGVALGLTQLTLTSSGINPINVPVFVTADFADVNTSRTPPVGVRVETAPQSQTFNVRLSGATVGVRVQTTAGGQTTPVLVGTPTVGVRVQTTAGGLTTPVLVGTSAVGVRVQTTAGGQTTPVLVGTSTVGVRVQTTAGGQTTPILVGTRTVGVHLQQTSPPSTFSALVHTAAVGVRVGPP